jgi:hypothetical protein
MRPDAFALLQQAAAAAVLHVHVVAGLGDGHAHTPAAADHAARCRIAECRDSCRTSMLQGCDPGAPQATEAPGPLVKTAMWQQRRRAAVWAGALRLCLERAWLLRRTPPHFLFANARLLRRFLAC